MVAMIDLGNVQTIEGIRITFLNNLRAWIAPPSSVTFETSIDGLDWGSGGDSNVHSYEEKAASFWLSVGTNSRYLRITALQAQLPNDHPGAGHAAWLFADEIIVR